MIGRRLLGVAGAALMLALCGSPAASASGLLGGRHLGTDPPFGHARPAARAPQTGASLPSPWQPLANQPSFIPGTMLLASDGSVLVHEEPETGGTRAWYRLTPDASGSYANGTWSRIAPMPAGYAPLYFASAILPDGRMIVEGGEYNGESGEGVWTNLGAIYDPAKNSWKRVPPPPGWTNIGDAQGEVLANGTFMLSQACQNCLSEEFELTRGDALFNASGLTWTTISGQGKNDPNDEEGWTLEPSGQLLTVDTWLTPSTELFTPGSLRWSPAGNTPVSPVNSAEVEIGPQAGMPGGNVLAVGGGTSSEIPPEPCTTHKPAATALYDYAAGRWKKGPSIPLGEGVQYDSADGPGATLPDGNVLFDVSPCVYNTPLAFYLYEAATNKLVPVADIPNAANDSTYYTRMLVLPNGQVLFNDGSPDMELYTASAAPNPAWAPVVTSISSSSVKRGQAATLGGLQLAGLDQGAAYGDDVQSATNFPLVRITDTASGTVTYARTSNWSSVSIAPGAGSTTRFTVPKSAPAGEATLEVVANGIASAPVGVTIR